MSRTISPWSEQPGFAPEFSDSVSAYSPFQLILPSVNRLLDIKHGRYLSPGSSQKTTVAAGGIASTSGGATTFDVGSSFKCVTDSPFAEYTMICVLSTTATPSGGFAWSHGGSGGTNYMGLRSAGSSTSIQPSWFAGTNQTFTGTKPWADGNLHVITMSFSRFDRRIYIDDSLAGSATSGLILLPGYSNIGIGGLNRNSAELPLACSVFLLAGFHSAMPDALCRSIGRDPWGQLFAPLPRRILVPSAGGGYTHPTLSNARVGSITTTGGIPLVDYTF